MSDAEVVHVEGQAIVAQTGHDPLEQALKKAQYRSALLEKLTKVALSRTGPQDWIDIDGTPYLMESGAAKIARQFGISFTDVRDEKTVAHDDKGEYYLWTVRGKVGFIGSGETIEAIGTCSSRDKFFSTAHGKDLPLSEIDEGTIRKAAWTNAFVNGVKRLLGLGGLTWDDLAQYGLKPSAERRVKHTGREPLTDEQRQRARQIGEYLLAKHNGNKEAAANELKMLTTFSVTENGKKKTIQGKTSVSELTGKQVDRLWNELKGAIQEFYAAGGDEGDGGAD